MRSQPGVPPETPSSSSADGADGTGVGPVQGAPAVPGSPGPAPEPRADDPAAALPGGPEDPQTAPEPADAAPLPAPAEPDSPSAADADPGAAPPPGPSPGALEIEIEHVRRDLDRANARVDEQLDELRAAQRRADEHAAVARRQTEMADELHAENRTLRQGQLAQALDPLVRGIARFADDLDRIALGDPTPADVTYLRGQVDELLHDAGVTQLRPSHGDPFDPSTQQAAGTAPTADRALDRTVAEVRRGGLRRDDGRVLRPAEVVVHRFAPAEPTPPGAPAGDRTEDPA